MHICIFCIHFYAIITDKMFKYQEDQEVGAHLGEDDQYFAVELGRGNRGFGFSIRGGREFHSMPLFVLRMAVDGELLSIC